MSVARAADKAFGLALRVNGIRQSRLDLAELVDQLRGDWALYPLLHLDGSVGLMAIDTACTVAFVEQQTLGQVHLNAPDLRTLTRTDKALAMGFVEKFLSLFDRALEGAPTAHWTRGYRAEGAAETHHLMALQLDASDYRGFEIMSDIISVSRAVSVRLYLPIKEQGVDSTVNSKSAKPSKDAASPKNGAKMRLAVMAAKVELDAVMCKISLSLSELQALKVDQLLALPRNASQHAQLRDRTGKTSISVDLGQLHGMRAVRMKGPILQSEKEQPKSGDSADGASSTVANAPSIQVQDQSRKSTPAKSPDENSDEQDTLLEAAKI